MSIRPRIIGVLAQIAFDLTGQDQLQVFQRGVVDEIVQRRALVEVAGFSVSFLSDLENGKQTAELGKALDLVNLLGLDVEFRKRDPSG